MLLRRITKHVTDQNWFAVFIDFLIVVVGILIAFQITDWSEERAVRAETDRTLGIVIQTIEAYEIPANSFKLYNATTKAYGETALKAWEDQSAFSDSEFLVAAYQASQIMGANSEIGVVAELIGADNIRHIKNSDLQHLLRRYVSNPIGIMLGDSIDTPYRQNVRRTIPFSIQEKIRAECGDQRDDVFEAIWLPASCVIDLPVESARIAAKTLRARTDLRDDLQWHMASIQSILFDLDSELDRNRALVDAIKAYIE